MPPPLEIRTASPDDPAVAALIRLHVGGMHEATPIEFAYALDPSGLSGPGIRLLAAWQGDDLAGIGALAELDPAHAEIKSMRTAPGYLRQGVAKRILDELLATARRLGFTRVSLETGTGLEFVPAVALYEAAGFEPTDAFGDYVASQHNRFLTLELDEMAHPQQFDDDDPLLARLSELALAYPDAAMKVSHGRPAFYTTKVFAYFGGNEKSGDGSYVDHPHCVMVLPDEVERPMLLEDDRTFLPMYLAPSGWIAFELPPLTALADAWEEIDDLLDASYRRTAGPRRVSRLDAAS